MLLGKGAPFEFANVGAKYRSLLRRHTLEPIPEESEIAFLAGHINGWKTEVISILKAIGALAGLPHAEPVDALQALYLFAEKWGASNYIAKKVAFVMSLQEDHDEIKAKFNDIANLLEQEKATPPYFVALESISRDIPYFETMSTRAQVFSKYVEDDFRQLLPLHNIACSPVDRGDVGSFLRKCHSMSLVDEVVGYLQIRNLARKWPDLVRLSEQLIDAAVLEAVLEFEAIDIDGLCPENGVENSNLDESYFRNSLAFAEFREPCEYRDFVDTVIAPRLLRSCKVNLAELDGYPVLTAKDLCKAYLRSGPPVAYKDIQSGGVFLRTVRFLIYLQNVRNAQLDHHQVRHIFERTKALSLLLSEQELESLYRNSDDESRPLVTILALALFRDRSHDEDADFEFRFSLIDIITRRFERDLIKFIGWLIPSTPEIAHFLAGSLDRTTLQKLYGLVSSVDEADRLRQSILRIVGKNRQRIEYFIEADAIEAQRQVSKLHKYFDESRIYVDGFAMKKWLSENPNSYAQQYLKLIEHSSEVVSALTITAKGERTVGNLSVNTAYDYILFEVAKAAFHEFCTNKRFGIESYLGRRIRHNTLKNMMRNGVENIVEDGQYQVLRLQEDFMYAYNQWVNEYRSLIERIRSDHLQFRTDSKTKGLFTSRIEDQPDLTNSNIALLRSASAVARKNELFEDLIIRFCWQQIDPQLRVAAKYITVDLLKEAQRDLDAHLGGFSGQLHKQLWTELRNAIHEKFIRLGSWFRQPESGFVSASTKKLGDLIAIESTGDEYDGLQLEWQGDSFDVDLDGPSVHRVYDCLSVVIRNALSYTEEGTPVRVLVRLDRPDRAQIAKLTVEVRSVLTSEPERSEHVRRLHESFVEEDLDASMGFEGYSGIRKLRFITQNSEGRPTAFYKIDDDICLIAFGLTVELAQEEALEGTSG